MTSKVRCILGSVLSFSVLVQSAYGLDLARKEMRVEEAWEAFGVSGKDIVVAVIDRGIDYTHPDFRKPNGKTRIKWLLDMPGSQCPGPPGVEYSEAQINAALDGGPEVPSYDRVGHGTATAGSAAGNGRALPDRRFRGIAYEADLLIVKHVSEGAPANDEFPAEEPFLACLGDALDWVVEKLDELGKPGVAIINTGTQWGPQDGTTILSQLIDEHWGDTPGRIMVLPSGDEGSLPSHGGGTFDASKSTAVRFNKTSDLDTRMTAWYSGDVPAEVTVSFDGGPSVTAGPGQDVSDGTLRIIHYIPGNEFWRWQNSGGDRAVLVVMGDNEGPGEISFRALDARKGLGTFDVYTDVRGPGLTAVTELLDHLVPGRITDKATTRSAIISGNHVDRVFYTDIDGFQRGSAAQGAVGELWLKSGRGPTRDGRTYGVDVTTPGQGSFVSLGQQSHWKDLPSIQPQEGEGMYVRFGGTSGSAPMLTGLVALMLEMKPTLTNEETREILRETAVGDANTGVLPNVNWGFGKADAFAALERLEGVPVSAPHSASWFDSSHDGEGWLLEVLAPETKHVDGSKTPGVALAYWFTYPPSGQPGTQAWVVAVGSIEGDTITFDDAMRPTGGVFGPGFDPDTVTLEPWGSFKFRFLTCDTGVMTYQGPAGWGNGFLDMQRITLPAGLDCSGIGKQEPSQKTGIGPGFSGSWFDPSHNGEGWLIEILSDELALVYWFTYDASGRQAWFTGVGTIDGKTITVEFLQPAGPEFGPDFNPDEVDLKVWGNAVFTFEDCVTGSMTYESQQGGFGSGELDLERITELTDVSCE